MPGMENVIKQRIHQEGIGYFKLRTLKRPCPTTLPKDATS
jgi:hypothetical protein